MIFYVHPDMENSDHVEIVIVFFKIDDVSANLKLSVAGKNISWLWDMPAGKQAFNR